MKTQWKKRFFAVVLSAVLCVAALCPAAVAAVVLPDLPADQCVVDDAGVLSSSTFTYFDQLNGKLEQSCSGAQIALLTVQYTGSAETEEYAVEAFNAWGVGSSSENNGVLILLVMESPYYADGDYYVTLGDGFRNTTLYKQTSAIVQNAMEDYFAAGNYDAAAIACADVVADTIADLYGVSLDGGASQPAPQPKASLFDRIFDAIFYLAFFLIFLVLLFCLVAAPIGRGFGWSWGPFGWHAGPFGWFGPWWFGPRSWYRPPRRTPPPPPPPRGPRGPGGPGNMGGFSGGGRSGGGFSGGGFSGMGGGGSHGGGGGRGR